MTASATPIMVRARITRDEWEAVRVFALQQNRSAADLIAEAVRDYLTAWNRMPRPNLTSKESTE